jgi:O6-methylguanine-DNA--protein-cysteine methyltransferase
VSATRPSRTTTAFTRRVLTVLARIPPGRVITYGDLARLAGRPGAASAPGLPYHRVVAAGGRVGGYGSAPRLKAALLAAEGLRIRGTRIVDFKKKRLA